MFIVKNAENRRNIYRVTVKDDVKLMSIMTEKDRGFEEAVDKFWTNEVIFSKGANNVIEHTILQNVSSGEEKGEEFGSCCEIMSIN